MKRSKANFSQDGKYLFEEIVGNIKKIFILTDRPMSYVSIAFFTNEGELIYKVKLNQPMTTIYPYNFIDVQGRGTEYYSEGNILIEIEGLTQDDAVKQISIFYR